MTTAAFTRDDRKAPAGLLTELLGSAAAGDKGAWDALVDHFGPMVAAVARGHRLSAADVADVAQTTWLRLFEHLGRIQDPERVGGWLATTARRESLRLLRLSGREVASDDARLTGTTVAAPGLDVDLIRQEQISDVREAFRRLPARAQVLLGALMSESAPSYRALSDALDMPIGSIGPTRQRYLRHLRQLIETDRDVELEMAA